MSKKRQRCISRWTAITATGGWVLANGLDVFSVLLMILMGSRPVILTHHAAEYLMIYAGMRLLGTLAMALLVIWLVRHWPSWQRAIWGGLTVCSVATALLAWLRLYR